MRNTLLKFYQSQTFIWAFYLLVAILLYFSILNNFFVSDDWHWLYLSKNRPWDWSIFWTNYEGLRTGGSYNPLLLVIWKFLYSLFGLHQFWYHLVSVLLHASNAYLVYLLAKRLLTKLVAKSYYWSSLCGLFYLLWPVQVEAIAWVAAWPHLWATFFALLSIIYYLDYKNNQHQRFFYFSLLFFVLAIFTKETVITLPLLIVLLDLYQKHKIKFFNILSFLAIALVFVFLRQQATGVLAGYYGQSNFSLKINEWLSNLAVMFLDWPSAGYFRNIFYKVAYHYSWWLAGAVVLFLLVYLFYLVKYKKRDRLYLFIILLISSLPFLPLGLHHTTFAGERYLYWPSVFFVIWFFSLLASLNIGLYKKNAILFFLAFCSLLIIHDKNIIWSQAARVSKNIVASYADLRLEPGARLISVALPDNLLGAEVFRNNLQQALELYYPNNHPEISPLPVYVQLNRYNKNYHLLSWRTDDRGWFLESIDHGFVVTGRTSITVNNVYFELWHYNYQNFTSNLIRLIPGSEILTELKQGNIRWLTFDRGKLMVK